MANIFDNIVFNAEGLIPAIAQCSRTGKVLMLAWMNRAAIEKTLETRQVHYWSRSRKSLWRKGETSGHTQSLKEFIVDCDGDTILLKVEQKGVACHTGRETCFFQTIEDGGVRITLDPVKSPGDIYKKGSKSTKKK